MSKAKRSKHKSMCALVEGAFMQPSESVKSICRVRERMTTIERSYLDSLRNCQRPTIRVQFDPNAAVKADYLVPSISEPKLRRPKFTENTLRVPSRPRRSMNLSLSPSTSFSPRLPSRHLSPVPSYQHFPSLSDSEIPRFLPSTVNYRRNVIKKINRFENYSSK